MPPVPVIFDEFLLGYRGRIAGLNCLSDPRKVLSADIWEGAMYSTFVEAAARVNGISIEQVLIRHTCYPLRDLLGPASTTVPSECSVLTQLSLPTIYDLIAYCDGCVEEDAASEHHIAHWRRDHQIPGLLTCPVHTTQLRFVRQSIASCTPPTVGCPDAVWLSQNQYEAYARNPHIAVALGFLQELLRANIALDHRLCVFALYQELERQLPNRLPNARDLIQLIRDTYPPGWLDITIPAENRWHARKAGDWSFARTTSGIALAAGLLFPSPAIALARMLPVPAGAPEPAVN
ncbi:TniQ family protein [Variovorax sp. dw_308]|uniref:TniQ family protein n=1 Tax=Variovorax sp. dw_308 TaxID=2721546 RepID=UPI001C4426AD